MLFLIAVNWELRAVMKNYKYVSEQHKCIREINGDIEKEAKVLMENKPIKKQDIDMLVQCCQKRIDATKCTTGSLYDLVKAYVTSGENNKPRKPVLLSIAELYKQYEAELSAEEQSLNRFVMVNEPIILSSTSNEEMSRQVNPLSQCVILLYRIIQMCDKVTDKLIEVINAQNDTINKLCKNQ